jgi:uncharacterized protein (DUF427 family)
MPKNPYRRVDALPSGRHIQVLVNGVPLATSHRPALVIETGVPPRWYIPPGDVRWDRLTPSLHHTTCQYKGQAHYWTVDGTDPPLPVWSYPEPLPEAASLAGLIGIPDDDPQCNCSSTTPQPTTRTSADTRPCATRSRLTLARLRR